MGLDDLLARLERAAGTAGTAEKDKGGGDSSEPLPTDTAPPVRATRWLLHYADREPMEVWFAPAADHAEALVGARVCKSAR